MLPATESLSSWENEGGAIETAPHVVRPDASPARAHQRDMDQVLSERAPPASDKGIVDTRTLTIMRLSLLLFIPAIGALAVFWGLFVGAARP